MISPEEVKQIKRDVRNKIEKYLHVGNQGRQKGRRLVGQLANVSGQASYRRPVMGSEGREKVDGGTEAGEGHGPVKRSALQPGGLRRKEKPGQGRQVTRLEREREPHTGGEPGNHRPSRGATKSSYGTTRLATIIEPGQGGNVSGIAIARALGVLWVDPQKAEAMQEDRCSGGFTFLPSSGPTHKSAKSGCPSKNKREREEEGGHVEDTNQGGEDVASLEQAGCEANPRISTEKHGQGKEKRCRIALQAVDGSWLRERAAGQGLGPAGPDLDTGGKSGKVLARSVVAWPLATPNGTRCGLGPAGPDLDTGGKPGKVLARSAVAWSLATSNGTKCGPGKEKPLVRSFGSGQPNGLMMQKKPGCGGRDAQRDPGVRKDLQRLTVPGTKSPSTGKAIPEVRHRSRKGLVEGKLPDRIQEECPGTILRYCGPLGAHRPATGLRMEEKSHPREKSGSNGFGMSMPAELGSTFPPRPSLQENVMGGRFTTNEGDIEVRRGYEEDINQEWKKKAPAPSLGGTGGETDRMTSLDWDAPSQRIPGEATACPESLCRDGCCLAREYDAAHNLVSEAVTSIAKEVTLEKTASLASDDNLPSELVWPTWPRISPRSSLLGNATDEATSEETASLALVDDPPSCNTCTDLGWSAWPLISPRSDLIGNSTLPQCPVNERKVTSPAEKGGEGKDGAAEWAQRSTRDQRRDESVVLSVVWPNLGDWGGGHPKTDRRPEGGPFPRQHRASKSGRKAHAGHKRGWERHRCSPWDRGK